MQWGQLAYLVKARWILILISAIAAMSLVALVNLLAPASYRAVASVLVDTRGVNPMSTAAAQTPDEAAAALGTTTNVARSEGLARRVAASLTEPLRSKVLEGVRVAPGTDATSVAARWLLDHLSVLPGGQNSHVLDFRFVANDPAVAAQLANGFANGLIQYTIDLRVKPALADARFFDDQVTQLRNRLDEAQTMLTRFQREHAITSTEQSGSAEAARLRNLGTELSASEAAQSEQSARALRTGPAEEIAEVMAQPAIQSLVAEVARQEAQVKEQAERLGPNHPQLMAARAQLEASRAALERQTALAGRSVGMSSSIGKKRSSLLTEAYERQQQRVLELVALRPQLETLESEVGEARRAYQFALNRRNELSLRSQYGLSEVSIISEAMPSDARTRPGLGLLLLAGAVLGVLAGVMVVIASDRASPRIRSSQDYVSLGLPILADVPVLSYEREPRQRKLLSIQLASRS